jgi:hypothetical protein
MGFLTHVKTLEKTDPNAAVTALGNFEDAKKLHAQGNTVKDTFQKTNWMNLGNDEWRFMLDLKDMDLKFDNIDRFIREAEAIGALDFTQVTLGDILQHPRFFEAYPELVNYKVNIHFRPAKPEEFGYKVTVGEQDYIISGSGSNPRSGASVNTRTQKMDLFGTAQSNGPGRLAEQVMHEVEHIVQNIEGFSRGGSPVEFDELSQVDMIAKHYIATDLLDRINAGDLVVDDSNVFNIIRRDYPSILKNTTDDFDEMDTLIDIEDGLKFLQNLDAEDLNMDRITSDSIMDDFVQWYSVYRGNNKEEELVDLLSTISPEVAAAMSKDMYYALRGEGFSRMAETLTRLRKVFDPSKFDPEKALEAEFTTKLPTGRLPLLKEDGTLNIIDLAQNQQVVE